MRPALVAFAVLRFGLRLELGPEYDSNANRAETVNGPPVTPMGETPPALPIGSFLFRSTAAATLGWTHGPNALRLGATFGAKYFLDDAAGPQDVAVVQLAVDDTLSPGALGLGLGGDYYDAWQWKACPQVVVDARAGPIPTGSCHRDFRSGGPRLHAGAALGDHDLTVGVGGRAFRWKPDDLLQTELLASGRQSFDAPYVDFAVTLRFRPGDGEREWDLGFGGRAEVRAYHAIKLRSADDPGTDDAGPRIDVDTVLSLSLTHVGPLMSRQVLAQIGYALDDDHSNSYGQGYRRHFVSAKLGIDLPLRIVATIKGQLAFTSYSEPAVLRSGMTVPLTIEDETRDALVIDLDRPLGAGFAIGARYSLYKNGASNAAIDYLRQVVYLGASYRFRQ